MGKEMKTNYKKYSIISLIVSILSLGASYLIFLSNKPEIKYDDFGEPMELIYSNLYGDILFYIGLIAFVVFAVFLILSFVKRK